MRLRKNMKRTAAAALALSVAVSAAMPASAGYNIDMSQVTGDITITKDASGAVSVTGSTKGVENTDDDDDTVTIRGGNQGKSVTTESEANETTPVKQESTQQKGVISGGRVVTSSMGTRLPGTVGSGAVVTSGAIARGGMVRSSVQSWKSSDEDVVTYESKDETPIEKVATAFEKAVKYVVKIINNDKTSDLDVVLDNVNIRPTYSGAAVSVSGEGNTTIELEGKNTLKGAPSYAGIEHKDGEKKIVDRKPVTITYGKLTIKDDDNDGELEAIGGDSLFSGGGAGIGGNGSKNAGSIEIKGGKITAKGGRGAADDTHVSGTADMDIGGGGAGIGGGGGSASYKGDDTFNGTVGAGSANDITISGGDVTAIGGNGYGYSKGGTRKRTSGGGAGIGTGGSGVAERNTSAGSNITIKGDAVINAQGGTSKDADGNNIGGGAGIGGGSGGAGTVTIDGENVNIVDAIGGAGAAGIGGGYLNKGDVTLKNGHIGDVAGGSGTDKNGDSIGGAGIGGGSGWNGDGKFTMSGGSIDSVSGGEGAAGIGGGNYSDGDVTISGGKIGTVDGWSGGAGIGGGNSGDGKFTMSGGSIDYAWSNGENADGRGGAGIGSGADGNATITITGGTIGKFDEDGNLEGWTGAIGGTGAAGIGSGAYERNYNHYWNDEEEKYSDDEDDYDGGGDATISISGDANVGAVAGEDGVAIGTGKGTINDYYEGGEKDEDGEGVTEWRENKDAESANLDDVVSGGAYVVAGRMNDDDEFEAEETVGELNHRWEKVDTVPVTCTADGYEEWECSECGAVEHRNIKKKLGHDFTKTERVEPTCTVAGYTATVCSRCDAEKEGTRVALPLADHSYNTFVETVKPTCTAGGYDVYKCDNCTATTKKNETKALEHHMVHAEDAVAATCTTTGKTEKLKCDRDGCIYTEGGETTEIDPTNHVKTHLEGKTAATCKDTGFTGNEVCDACGTVVKQGETIAKNDDHSSYGTHIEGAKAATCKEEGYSGDEVCNGCGEVVKQGHATEKNASNHSDYGTSLVNAKAATCKEEGYTGDEVCNGCGAVLKQGETIEKAAHTPGDWEVKTAPTYLTEGEEVIYCTECGAELDSRPIPKLVDNSSDDNSADNVVTIDTAISVVGGSGSDILHDGAQVQLYQVGSVLYIEADTEETAAIGGTLSDLAQLMDNGIETVVFTTSQRTSTIHLAEVVALGSGETTFTLSHNGAEATLTVGGADHSELIH